MSYAVQIKSQENSLLFMISISIADFYESVLKGQKHPKDSLHQERNAPESSQILLFQRRERKTTILYIFLTSSLLKTVDPVMSQPSRYRRHLKQQLDSYFCRYLVQ